MAEEEDKLYSGDPPAAPGPSASVAEAVGEADALDSVATYINDFFAPSGPDDPRGSPMGAVASRAIQDEMDSGNMPAYGEDFNDRAGLGPGEKSDLANRAAAESASMMPEEPKPAPGPGGEWVGAGGAAGAPGRPQLKMSEYGPIPAGFDPVAVTPEGLLVDANGKTHDPRTTAIAVNPPVIPEYNRAYGGKYVPAHELQVGRKVGVEQEAPIPQDAMDAYMVAFADRQVGAQAKAAAAEAEAYIRRQAEIGTAQAEAEGIARQQVMAEQQNQIYSDYKNRYESRDVDPMRAWNNKSGFQKVMGVIGVFLGGFGARANGGRNIALDMIHKQINDDIASQESNRGAAKTSMDMLDGQFNRERGDLDLERAYRLKAVEKQVSMMIAGANIDANQAEALKRDLVAPIVQEYGDLLDRAAQRSTGKRMEEIAYQTQKGQYVGGGGGGLTVKSAMEIYNRTYQDARSRDNDDKTARQMGAEALKRLGANARVIGTAMTYAHTGGLPPEDTGGARGTPIEAYGSTEQKERRDNFILTGPNGEGIYRSGLTPQMATSFYNKMTSLDNLESVVRKLQELQQNNATGNVLGTDDQAEAAFLIGMAKQLSNEAFRAEAMSESDSKMYDRMLGRPDKVINIGGAVKLRTLQEMIDIRKRDAERRLGGTPAVKRFTRGKDGGLVEVVEMTGQHASGPVIKVPAKK